MSLDSVCFTHPCSRCCRSQLTLLRRDVSLTSGPQWWSAFNTWALFATPPRAWQGALGPAQALLAHNAMSDCRARCAELGIEAASSQLQLASTMGDSVLSHGAKERAREYASLHAAFRADHPQPPGRCETCRPGLQAAYADLVAELYLWVMRGLGSTGGWLSG